MPSWKERFSFALVLQQDFVSGHFSSEEAFDAQDANVPVLTAATAAPDKVVLKKFLLFSAI